MGYENETLYRRGKVITREELVSPYLFYYEEIDIVVRTALQHYLGNIYDDDRAYLIQREHVVAKDADRIIELIATDGYPYYVCMLGDLLPFL